MRRAIGKLILEAEHIWNSPLVTRVHSDREGGIESISADLHQSGIWSTVNQGWDPQANGRAECAVGLLSNGARARLLTLGRSGVELTDFTRMVLWAHAMVHAAMSYNTLGATEASRIKKGDILPFGSRVLARHGPKKPLSTTEAKAVDAIYLHPSVRCPEGHLVADLERLPSGHQHEFLVRDSRVAVTLRSVQNDGKLVYPSFRIAPMGAKLLRVVQDYGRPESVSPIPAKRKRSEPEDTPGPIHPSKASRVDPVPSETSESARRNKRRPSFNPEVDGPPPVRKSARIRLRQNTATFAAAAPSVCNLARALLSVQTPCADHGAGVEDILGDAMAYATRLCTPAEARSPPAKEAERKQMASILSNRVVCDNPVELDDIPDGSEVAPLRSIMPIKDLETDAPSCKGRVIYRGGMPKIKRTDAAGGTFFQKLKGKSGVWSSNAADQSAVRLLLAFALARGYDTWTCDFETAYPQAIPSGRDTYVAIHDELAEALPEGIRARRAGLQRPVHKLLRALYGRRQSGYDWGQRLIQVLEKYGFVRAIHHNGLHLMKSRDALVAVYVDDCCLAAPRAVVDTVFGELCRDLKIKVSGDGSRWRKTKRFLGTEYVRADTATHRVALIQMDDCTRKLIADFEARYGPVRVSSRLPDVPPATGVTNAAGNQYRHEIGALLWLCRALRADCARAVNGLAACVTFWSDEHTASLRLLFGFLKGTADTRMAMAFDNDHKPDDLKVMCWSDASLGLPRSVSGHFIALVGASQSTFTPIGWSSKRQSCVATSSAAAEYMALSRAVESAMPVKEAAVEVGVCAPSPLKCRVGNTAVLLGISRGFAPYDAVFSALGRAAQFRMTQLCDLATSNAARFTFEPTTAMRADGLTKCLTTAAAVRHARALMRLCSKVGLDAVLPPAVGATAGYAVTDVPFGLPDGLPDWETVLEDKDGGATVRVLRGAIPASDLGSWEMFLERFPRWHKIQNGTGDTVRSTAWFTERPCRCSYSYGKETIPAEPLKGALTRMRSRIADLCGLELLPNAANVSHYADGTQACGWHSDDEPLFRSVGGRCLIVSLSLGAARAFCLRPRSGLHDLVAPVRVTLHAGDLLTMEGHCQSRYQHMVPREDCAAPRYNVTWRWLIRRDHDCPTQKARRTALERARQNL